MADFELPTYYQLDLYIPEVSTTGSRGQPHLPGVDRLCTGSGVAVVSPEAT